MVVVLRQLLQQIKSPARSGAYVACCVMLEHVYVAGAVVSFGSCMVMQGIVSMKQQLEELERLASDRRCATILVVL